MSIDPTGQTDNDPYKGEREGKLREVGSQAVWSLSSCKPGTHTCITRQLYNLMDYTFNTTAYRRVMSIQTESSVYV